MAKKNRKANKKTERGNGFIVTTWIDDAAGCTPKEREEYWGRTRDERYNDGSMDGIGFRQYDPATGLVMDYEFNTMDDCKAFTCNMLSLESVLAEQARKGKEIGDDEPVNVSFAALGIAHVNLRHPNAEEFVRRAVDNLFAMRAGEIEEWRASLRAAMDYYELKLNEAPEAV